MLDWVVKVVSNHWCYTKLSIPFVSLQFQSPLDYRGIPLQSTFPTGWLPFPVYNSSERSRLLGDRPEILLQLCPLAWIWPCLLSPTQTTPKSPELWRRLSVFQQSPPPLNSTPPRQKKKTNRKIWMREGCELESLRESSFSLIDGALLYGRPWNATKKTDVWRWKWRQGNRWVERRLAHLQQRRGGAPLNDAAGYNREVGLGCN